jgi:maltooligosyltrehalose trehalohydrolase
LVLENEHNIASHLRPGRFDAQWNDDIHHALHVLLTGETGSYYRDFADRPAAALARALSEGFVYQGQASQTRKGAPRGQPSADLPPTAFISFLQNHDQVGNRLLGERLTRLAHPDALKAAAALLLLAPQIPMVFMGEEIGSTAPFYFFTDHGPELAKAVREGRRREFSILAQDHDFPDPNALESFEASKPWTAAPQAEAWRHLYRQLLALRHRDIVPFLRTARSLGGRELGPSAAIAHWQLGEGRVLTLACNFGETEIEDELPQTGLIWGMPAAVLQARTTLAWLQDA